MKHSGLGREGGYDSLNFLSNYNKRYYLNFCGSLAYYFKSYIKNISKKKEYKIGKIISKPISYLAEYHSQ